MAKDEARYRQKWRGGFQQAGGLGEQGDDDDGVDDDDDCAVSDQDDGDDVESHQDSQGRGGPVLQGPEEEVPLLQGSMALDPEENNHLNFEFDILPQSCCQFSFKGGLQGNQNQVQPP